MSDARARNTSADCCHLAQGSDNRKYERRVLSLEECAAINSDQYSANEDWPFINYLDTGSITEGKIDRIQRLAPGIDKIPSRARRKCSVGDIVYSTVRPNQRHYGIIKQPPENLLVSTGFAVVRAKEAIADTGYIYRYLTQDHIVDFLHALAEHSKSAYPSIRPTDLARLEVALPPLDEQRRVADILGVLDDRIELNQRMCETLEETVQALFRAWFVDFEPVLSKMKRRWRRGQSLPGLPAHLYDLFPDDLADSELGLIPAGWRIGTVSELCVQIDNGGTPKRNDDRYWDGRIPWFVTAELQDGPLAHSGECITQLGLEASSCKLWPAGTILIALYASPTVGRLGLLTIDATANQACCGLQAKPAFGPYYVYGTLYHAREWLQSVAVGSAQQNISQRIVRELRSVIADSEVHRAFDDIVSPIWKSLMELTDQSRLLADARDTLLPELISGKLRLFSVADDVARGATSASEHPHIAAAEL
ncbi:restriction endonuclease subunit S [Candidatus Poriferisodalis sp.]|uniref:restriction endonuclease subunit S n=1 Tax=Candidatus Poriferisodalis sp. TaxID=3101277 RepID=UPI003B59C6FD